MAFLRLPTGLGALVLLGAACAFPAAAQGSGRDTAPRFEVVLSDDFSRGYRTELWGAPFHGSPYWNNGFWWDRDDVQVRDGVLEVTTRRHPDGRWTAGGFNSYLAGHTITYGRVEFDARVEQAQGTTVSILMWPKSNDWPKDGEINIIETPRGRNMMTSHWQTPGGRHTYDNQFSDAFDARQWNRYRLTWLPDRLTVEVNGRRVAEWTRPEAIPRGPMGFGAMGFVGTANESWMGGAPDATTPSRVTMQIDNVVMSQWRGE